MSTGRTAVLALFVLVGTFLWSLEHQARVREAASARKAQDSLVAVIRDSTAAREARHTADSLQAAQRLQAHTAALAAARRSADSAKTRLAMLLDSLEALAPDSIQGFIHRILAAGQADRDALVRERTEADATIAELKGRIDALEVERVHDLGVCTQQLNSALAQLDRANRRASPGLLRRLTGALPWLAGAFLVGLAL